MTSSDEAFLDEVGQFLSSCSPTLLSPSKSANNNEALHVQKPNRRLTVKLQLDAATKRELEKAKDRKRRNSYRERRRLERESLQKEVRQLTEEVQKAQGPDNLYASVWKLLGERQNVARVKAEAEQHRLRDSLNSNAALLQRFSNRLTNVPDVPGDMGTAYEHKRVRLEPSDDSIFAAYLDELAGVYAQTEEVLSSMHCTEANWDDPIETWIKDSDTGYFLYRGKLTLPFDYRDICRSRWFTAPLHHRKESRQLYENVDDPNNTIALKFRITTRLSSDGFASVLQRLVVRRYEESERMVIVWRLFTEGEGAFNGMHADETGWGVSTPVKNASKTGTVMTTCVRNVPMHLRGVATRELELKQFADKLVEWGSENNDKVTLRLKNLVLEDEYR